MNEEMNKPYYYMRNGLLHVKFTADHCMKLSKQEEDVLKEELSKNPAKQRVLATAWKLFERENTKEIYTNGVEQATLRIKSLSGMKTGKSWTKE